MNKIFIIKKIQIGERTFPVENQNSKLSFNFYCGNGGVKHKTILSLKDSDLLDSLIENAKIDYKDLVTQSTANFVTGSWKEHKFENTDMIYYESKHKFGVKEKIIYHFILKKTLDNF